jgi:leucyl/phenylalanyl-tRNA--protein transferase
MRRSYRRFETRVDTAFEEVLGHCADRSRPGSWITRRVKEAYGRLHQLGWAHSVETWSPSGKLVGGLYGVAVGGLFAGESMFHHERDASKVALMALVEVLTEAGGRLLDVQWLTPHLASLGAVAVSRRRYHELLADALAAPQIELAAA